MVESTLTAMDSIGDVHSVTDIDLMSTSAPPPDLATASVVSLPLVSDSAPATHLTSDFVVTPQLPSGSDYVDSLLPSHVSPPVASAGPFPLVAASMSSSTSTSTNPLGHLFDRTIGQGFNIARHRLINNAAVPLQKNVIVSNDSMGKPSPPIPTTTMTPAQFGNTFNKGPSSSSTTQNLMALLGDIKQCQMMAENDQKALEQNRLELKAVNVQMNQLSQKKITVQKQIGEGEVATANLASELFFVTIKEKVLDESLTKLQTDLAAGWESLAFIRSNMMSVSSQYLGDCTKYAMMYNCTELGSENRANALRHELEETRLTKNQLEYDLQKFLSMLTEVEKSEAENKELQQEYREQEENERQKEIEAYNKLSEMEGLLEQLEKRKASLDKSLLEDTKKLQAKLESTKQSISYWERRVSENQRMVGHQKNSIAMSTSFNSNTSNSATSPGFPSNSPGSIRLGNGQTIQTNNKIARVSQYVHVPSTSSTYNTSVPTKPNVKEVPVHPRKVVQTKLQFNNSKPPNPPFITPSKPKFNPPCVNVIPTIPSKSLANNSKNPEDDDPFNDSFSSSQYFKMPESKSCSNIANSSNQSMSQSSCENNVSYSSASGRTFQFKKKPSVVQGPATPCRTASVPLGTMPLPFSTFQTGRAVLQEKQLLENTADFDVNLMDSTTTDY